MADTIVLVAMPWALLQYPSIPLGILSSVLRNEGLTPVVRSFNLAFVDFLQRTRGDGDVEITCADYQQLADSSANTGLADWVFSLPPFRAPAPDDDRAFLDALYASGRIAPALIDKARALRQRVPAFIEACVDDLLALQPAMVGLTTTFSQNVPSLLLARRLRERDPSPRIVFGGANCDGAMGRALIDAFPFVDVVVQGEAELVIVPIVRDIIAGRPVVSRPGVLTRVAAPAAVRLTSLGAARAAPAPPRPQMDDIPTPDYDFYFEALDASSFRDEILPGVRLLVETARGCWWGQKNHCTFCGLNGESMTFRSKSIERALRDFTTLAARYRCLDFFAVDNIIDLEYLRELLPRLKDTGIDFRIFYETKSNLTKAQLRDMKACGITQIQPGIESLSTPILRLMKKGVTAWQNVRLLKWAMQYGIRVEWNIIYGFPGEPVEEYTRMAAAIPALVHLEPPNWTRLMVQRFSPYHERPAAYGLKLEGPVFQYRILYPPEVRLDDLAYYFDYTHVDGHDPAEYVGELARAITGWKASYPRSRGALRFRRGPGFIRIIDSREADGQASYLLEGEQAAIYLACDGGATPAAVCRELAAQGLSGVSAGEAETFLRELVDARLMFESDGRFLSLALPETAAAGIDAPAERAPAERAPAERDAAA